MSKFRFRLQPLLDRLLDKKEEAAKALADRRKELAAEQKLLEDLKQRERDLVAKRQDLRRRVLEPQGGQPLTGGSILQRRQYLDALGSDIESTRDSIFSQRLAVEEAEEKVNQAQAYLLKCQRDVDVLEKYRERLEQRFKREMERKEELELDEVGNMIFTSRRRTS